MCQEHKYHCHLNSKPVETRVAFFVLKAPLLAFPLFGSPLLRGSRVWLKLIFALPELGTNSFASLTRGSALSQSAAENSSFVPRPSFACQSASEMDKMDLRSRKLKRANDAASGSAPDKKRPVRSEPHEAEARRPRGDLLAVNSGAHWWRSAVIYQIYPRSFKDTTANGIGDINGIRSKLQYIASLGVNAVWLSPVFKSPMKDFGYDISDYKDVDPLFGNLKDMKALIDEMHFLGLKLILDLVPNHSSDQHDWFIKSVKKEEPYADYYVWAKPKNATQLNKEGVIPEPPNNWVSVFGGSAWEYSPERKEFYLHQFAKEQPDLNFRNPRVVHEMKQVLRFWLQMGVDGFRIDAVPHLFEDQELRDEPRSEKEDAQEGEYDYLDHIYTHGLPEVFEIMHEFRKVMDAYAEKTDKIPRLLLAEVYDSVENTMKYYGEHDQPLVDFPFNFLFVGELDRNPTAAHLKELIDRWMDALPAGACPNWVLGNHDKGRVASRIGLHYIDSLNMVTLLLPGVAFTYYGEEIGMEDVNLTWDQTVDPAGRNAGIDNFLKASRDPARSPMQWNINKNAGFSESISTWLPVNQNYLNGVNVEDQEDRPSHLQIYRALVKLRQSETFLKGGLQTEVLNEGKVFAMSRIYGDSGILVAVNLSNERLTANLTNLEQIPEDLSIYLSTKQELNATAVKSASVKLAPHQADVLIFKVEV